MKICLILENMDSIPDEISNFSKDPEYTNLIKTIPDETIGYQRHIHMLNVFRIYCMKLEEAIYKISQKEFLYARQALEHFSKDKFSILFLDQARLFKQYKEVFEKAVKFYTDKYDKAVEYLKKSERAQVYNG